MVVLLVGGVAGADQSGARSHFLSGLELYSQGKYAAALAEYQAAWVTWDDPELLLDMAECNRHLGNLDEAREQYRGFLERAPQSPLRGSVERQLARLD
ncbi:MAG TPA: tetratricopeptide repeat protein, partial [Polyangia bacterium]